MSSSHPRVTLEAYRDGRDRPGGLARGRRRSCTSRSRQATQNPYLANLSGLIRSEISLGFGAEPYSAQIRARAIEHHAELAERGDRRGRRRRSAATARAHFALTETVLRELVQKINDASPRIR